MIEKGQDKRERVQMTKTRDIIDLSDCQREQEQESGVADQGVADNSWRLGLWLQERSRSRPEVEVGWRIMGKAASTAAAKVSPHLSGGRGEGMDGTGARRHDLSGREW